MAGTPDHPITVTPNPNRVKVTFGGKVVADTNKALNLQEAKYPAVVYVPRADVDMNLLSKTAHSTHCPYKGDASYYSIKADGKTSENAIWSYENPFADMSEISGYVAFYPNRVDAIEQTPA
ncbi:MAG TPA: DUF427 domain-containing protein [Xanthobacteraceae bacterium]|nr:DUF427 domain-containing protein [Xanthobacteraceae bacterium]